MSELSHTSGSTLTSDPSKQEEEDATMVVEESKLRTRRPLMDLPKFEEVDCKYKDLILTLPLEKALEIRQYKGFWEFEILLPSILKLQEVFRPHPNDVFVASFPKSGTTWLKALVFTIVHRDKYNFSDHPLLKFSPHDCVRYLEHEYGLEEEQYLETLPVPRVLGTHQAYPILPESVKTSNCRIIYICREPKDVLVSYWHMTQKFFLLKEPISFAQYFELFCMGKVKCGPIWDHVMGYYTKSLQNRNKILFLNYEEMMSNPMDGVIRIANFVGRPFCEEEVKKGLIQQIGRFCSFKNMKDLHVNKIVGAYGAPNEIFFRKGVVGDWQNYMTAEMATKLDEITKEKLKGSGFAY